MEQYTTFKKLIDKLEEFANRHPNINSFGFGNLVEFGKDVDNTTPLYPLLFVVPQSVLYNEGLTTYGLQIFLADKLNDDNEGAVSIVSEMSLISKDLLATFKLNPDFMYLADFDFPITSAPFLERFNDVLAGVSSNINFNVSDYLDICQLKPLLDNKLTIDYTAAEGPLGPFMPYGWLRVRVNGVQVLQLTGETSTGIYDIPLESGDEVQVIQYSPATPALSVGYGNMDLYMGSEPLYQDTCNILNDYTFTAETSVDYTATIDYSLQCASTYDVNIYTRNGLWTGSTPGVIGRLVATLPELDQTFGINSGSTFAYTISRSFAYGTETQVSISDSLSGTGYQRTSIRVELNGGQIYENSCGSPNSFSFSGNNPNDVYDIYLEGDETCPIIPTPTPTSTATPTPTPTYTPTNTPTAQPTPTPSITGSLTPTPTPINDYILTEGSDPIETEGGDNLEQQ